MINEKELLVELAVIGCSKVNPENPLRVAVSIAHLVDLLLATEKYLDKYEQVMKQPVTMKRGSEIAELQNELEMFVKIARQKIGYTQNE